MSLIFCKDIPIQDMGGIHEMYNHNIIGLALLPDDKLVVIYTEELHRQYESVQHCSIKLFNLKNDKLLSRLDMPIAPHAIAALENDIAVTVPEERKIQFLSVSESNLSIGKYLSIAGCCQSIASNANNLYVACGKSIQIMNMNGKLMKKFETEDKTDGHFIAVSANGSRVYVSDFIQGFVVLLTQDGKIEGKYNYGQYLFKGLTVDKKGFVYICTGDSIYQLDENLGNVKELVTCPGLQTLSYSSTGHQLFIGTQNMIKVFQIK